MNIKIFFGLFLLLVSISCVENQNQNQNKYHNNIINDIDTVNTINLPKTFKIDQNITLIGHDFNITNGNKLGKIKEEVLIFTPTFKLYNKNNELVSKSKQTLFNYITEIKIFDNNGKYIGKFKQEIFKNLFSIRNTYSIYDNKNVKIGTSRKLDLFSTDIKIYDNKNVLIVDIKRPMINVFTDTWEVNIIGNIDPRIVVFIPCYKTYSDDKKKKQ